MNFSAARYCIAILVFLLLTVCGNPARAVDVASIRALAEQGDAEAENVLGTFYDKDKDYDEALKWFRKSAAQRFEVAEYNIGQAYYFGTGVPQDYAEAVKWYQKAAKDGYKPAGYVLYQIYDRGKEGVPRDSDKASYWLEYKAAGYRYQKESEKPIYDRLSDSAKTHTSIIRNIGIICGAILLLTILRPHWIKAILLTVDRLFTSTGKVLSFSWSVSFTAS